MTPETRGAVQVGEGMDTLSIKEVATQTGIAAGTIRMWETRYGFPDPARSPSGYRQYTGRDVEALRRVLALRERGLSVAAAIARAAEGSATDHPSIYAAVAGSDHGARPQTLRKSTLVALSRAIEHEALAQAAQPVLFGTFQSERFYRTVEPRYRRMSQLADAAVVFADFEGVRKPEGGPVEIPISPEDKLGNEWAVVVDAPGYAACLLAWEMSEDVGGTLSDSDMSRRFESIWTVDPRATRRASEVAAGLVGRFDSELSSSLTEMLHERPLAMERPTPGLTALTNRLVAYIESAAPA